MFAKASLPSGKSAILPSKGASCSAYLGRPRGLAAWRSVHCNAARFARKRAEAARFAGRNGRSVRLIGDGFRRNRLRGNCCRTSRLVLTLGESASPKSCRDNRRKHHNHRLNAHETTNLAGASYTISAVKRRGGPGISIFTQIIWWRLRGGSLRPFIARSGAGA